MVLGTLSTNSPVRSTDVITKTPQLPKVAEGKAPASAMKHMARQNEMLRTLLAAAESESSRLRDQLKLAAETNGEDVDATLVTPRGSTELSDRHMAKLMQVGVDHWKHHHCKYACRSWLRELQSASKCGQEKMMRAVKRHDRTSLRRAIRTLRQWPFVYRRYSRSLDLAIAKWCSTAASNTLTYWRNLCKSKVAASGNAVAECPSSEAEPVLSFTEDELKRCETMFAAIDHEGSGEVDVEAIFANYDASRNAMVRLLDLNCDSSTGKVIKEQWLQYMLHKKEAKGVRKFGFFLNYLESEIYKIQTSPVSTERKPEAEADAEAEAANKAAQVAASLGEVLANKQAAELENVSARTRKQLEDAEAQASKAVSVAAAEAQKLEEMAKRAAFLIASKQNKGVHTFETTEESPPKGPTADPLDTKFEEAYVRLATPKDEKPKESLLPHSNDEQFEEPQQEQDQADFITAVQASVRGCLARRTVTTVLKNSQLIATRRIQSIVRSRHAHQSVVKRHKEAAEKLSVAEMIAAQEAAEAAAVQKALDDAVKWKRDAEAQAQEAKDYVAKKKQAKKQKARRLDSMLLRAFAEDELEEAKGLRADKNNKGAEQKMDAAQKAFEESTRVAEEVQQQKEEAAKAEKAKAEKIAEQKRVEAENARLAERAEKKAAAMREEEAAAAKLAEDAEKKAAAMREEEETAARKHKEAEMRVKAKRDAIDREEKKAAARLAKEVEKQAALKRVEEAAAAKQRADEEAAHKSAEALKKAEEAAQRKAAWLEEEAAVRKALDELEEKQRLRKQKEKDTADKAEADKAEKGVEEEAPKPAPKEPAPKASKAKSPVVESDDDDSEDDCLDESAAETKTKTSTTPACMRKSGVESKTTAADEITKMAKAKAREAVEQAEKQAWEEIRKERTKFESQNCKAQEKEQPKPKVQEKKQEKQEAQAKPKPAPRPTQNKKPAHNSPKSTTQAPTPVTPEEQEPVPLFGKRTPQPYGGGPQRQPSPAPQRRAASPRKAEKKPPVPKGKSPAKAKASPAKTKKTSTESTRKQQRTPRKPPVPHQSKNVAKTPEAEKENLQSTPENDDDCSMFFRKRTPQPYGKTSVIEESIKPEPKPAKETKPASKPASSQPEAKQQPNKKEEAANKKEEGANKEKEGANKEDAAGDEEDTAQWQSSWSEKIRKISKERAEEQQKMYANRRKEVEEKLEAARAAQKERENMTAERRKKEQEEREQRRKEFDAEEEKKRKETLADLEKKAKERAAEAKAQREKLEQVRQQQAKREEERRKDEEKRRQRETDAYEKAKKAREDATNAWWKAQDESTRKSSNTSSSARGGTSAEDYYQRYKQEKTGGNAAGGTSGTSGFSYGGYAGSKFGAGSSYDRSKRTYSGYSAGSGYTGSSGYTGFGGGYGSSGHYGGSTFYSRNTTPSSPVKDFDGMWEKFASNAPSVVRLQDIPFPSKSWFRTMPMESAEREKKFKKLLMRWHPDKFMQKYGKKLDPKQKDKIAERVKETFQIVSDMRTAKPHEMRF